MMKPVLSMLSDEWAGLLSQKIDDMPEIGVGNGLSGMGLFFYFRYLETGNETDKEMVLSIFERIINRINSGYQSNALLIECTEVLLFMQITETLLATEYETAELHQQLSSFLEKSGHDLLTQEQYDPFTGCFFPAYCLQQINAGWNALPYLEILSDKTVYEDGERTSGYFDSLFQKGNLCLSITHGVAFYILFLSEAITKNKNMAGIKDLLASHVAFLMDNRVSFDTHGCFFPDYLGDKKRSRLCLCYGDLGILYALLKAAQVLNDNVLKAEVIRMLLVAGNRSKPTESGINNGSLLYGSTGVYLFYKYIHQQTNLAEFEPVIDFWRQEAGKNLADDFAIGRELYYKTKLMKKHLSFQEGITGALAVLNMKDVSSLKKLGVFFYLN